MRRPARPATGDPRHGETLATERGRGWRASRDAGVASERGGATEAGDHAASSLAVASEPPEADRWTDPRARLAERLRLAFAWRAWLAADGRRKASQIARRERLSRARVCQILALADLAPGVAADLLHGAGPVPNERQLYALARRPAPEQEAAYRALCEPAPPRPGEARAANATRSRGFQHTFARARRYQEILDEGVIRTLAELGRIEGVTGNRVGQVLLLLHLAPEIIAALDVPPEWCPAVPEKELRRIARMDGREAQVSAFRACVGRVADRDGLVA